MSYGFTLQNPDGFVKIADSFRPCFASPPTSQYMHHAPGVSHSPNYSLFYAWNNQTFFRPPYGINVVQTDGFLEAFEPPVAQLVHEIGIFSGPMITSSGSPSPLILTHPGNFGIEVFNASSEKIYSSNVAVFNVDTVIVHTIANSTVTFTLPAPPFGKRFVSMPFCGIYWGPSGGTGSWGRPYYKYQWALMSETSIRLTPTIGQWAHTYPMDYRGQKTVILSGYFNYG